MNTVLNSECTFAQAYARTLPRQWKPRIVGFVENVVPEYSDADFRQFFRGSPQKAAELTDLLLGDIQTEGHNRGKPQIDPYKQVLIFLLFMGTSHTVMHLANLFGVSESTVSKIVHHIVDILFTNHRETFIAWPTGDDAQKVMQDFEAKKGMKGVIGCIDGTHIAIACPKEGPEDYINRKGFHSLNLQATCTADLRITDAYAGWPGSAHDARVLMKPQGVSAQEVLTC